MSVSLADTLAVKFDYPNSLPANTVNTPCTCYKSDTLISYNSHLTDKTGGGFKTTLNSFFTG